MRLFLFLSLFFFILSCTTVEVTKEVIKATGSIKTTVEEILPKKEGQETNIEEDEIEKENEIIKEKKIIQDEKEKQKTIIKAQQKL